MACSQWRLRADQLALVSGLTARVMVDGIASFSFMIGLLVRETDQNGLFLPEAFMRGSFETTPVVIG